MKKNLLLLCLVLTGISVFGQDPVPNGDFENWTTTTFDNPLNYPNSSNFEEFFRYHLPFNIVKTTDAYHGNYAVELSTNASASDTVFGYFINIRPENAPSEWTGGMPYDQKPTGLRGWYKYNVATADSGSILVAFSQGGINIGTYVIKVGGVHTDYTLFDVTFDPALSVTPDSVALGAISCKFSLDQEEPHGPAGSTLILDSLSFTGVASQPDQMNGDFELWQTETFNSPDNWYLQNENVAGFNRTEDAAVGDYAVELKTTAGNQNNHQVARPGRVSTGYYPVTCEEDCFELGGYPFINQKDTLTFLYKYTPIHPEGMAWINVTLKKDGNTFWSQGVQLPASSDYLYTEMPFDAPQEPDSVIIDIQSSQWQDTAISFVGAILKVDDIHFKSQVIQTGIFNPRNENSFRIFPNPSNGLIHIEGQNSTIQRLEIYNLSGREVYTTSGMKNKINTDLDLSGYQKGMYFLKIYAGDVVQTEKLVIQ